MDYKIVIHEFEKAATKKGYCLDKDKLTDRYEDVWLQEAWELLMLIGSYTINTQTDGDRGSDETKSTKKRERN